MFYLKSSQNRGFVVDTFIRGPVNIYILLNEPVEIDRILLDCKVNAQITNGFQLATSTQPISNYHANKEKFLSTFYPIAKVLNEKNKNRHFYEFSRRSDNFNNTKLLASQPQQPPHFLQHNDNETNRYTFNSKLLANLNHANAICISITKTLNSSSPCLRSIKVYGKLLRSNAEEESVERVKKLDERPRVEIPVEFYDELTNDLMRMPIKLPSNKYVDKSTLDKYLSEKNKLNQVVTDPFTCVPFCSTYKPIIDEELKSKIDKFLFDNRSSCLIMHKSPVKLVKESSSPLLLSSLSTCVNAYVQKGAKRLRTNIGEVTSEQRRVHKCDLCLNKKVLSSSIAFYQLETCEHIYCRPCLFSISNVCIKCRLEFSNSQVVNIDRI